MLGFFILHRIINSQKLVVLTYALGPFIFLIELIRSQRLIVEHIRKRVHFSISQMFKVVVGMVLQMLILVSENSVRSNSLFVVVSHVVEHLLGCEVVNFCSLQLSLLLSVENPDNLLH